MKKLEKETICITRSETSKKFGGYDYYDDRDDDFVMIMIEMILVIIYVTFC